MTKKCCNLFQQTSEKMFLKIKAHPHSLRNQTSIFKTKKSSNVLQVDGWHIQGPAAQYLWDNFSFSLYCCAYLHPFADMMPSMRGRGRSTLRTKQGEKKVYKKIYFHMFINHNDILHQSINESTNTGHSSYTCVCNWYFVPSLKKSIKN